MIRRAEEKDVEKIEQLLFQVHKVHSDLRPDLFVEGKKKHSREEIYLLIKNDEKPIYVYTNENDETLGYCMCEYQITEGKESLVDKKVLYIDDLCVDEKARGQKIGEKLYKYVLEIAKKEGCSSVTLHIWEGNDAYKFYEKLGMKPLKTLMEEKLV